MAKIEKLTLKEMVNKKSQAYKQIKPDLDAMTERQIFKLISNNPRILIRPILSDGKKLLLGFKEDEYRAYIM